MLQPADAGNYTVVVSGTNPVHPFTSSTATLTVNQAVAITTQPASQTLCSGVQRHLLLPLLVRGLLINGRKEERISRCNFSNFNIE
jgi:hypothetical protein